MRSQSRRFLERCVAHSGDERGHCQALMHATPLRHRRWGEAGVDSHACTRLKTEALSDILPLENEELGERMR